MNETVYIETSIIGYLTDLQKRQFENGWEVVNLTSKRPIRKSLDQNTENL